MSRCRSPTRTRTPQAFSSSSAAKVSGGVGPDGDIVGFSTVCPHKGFPLGYTGRDRTLNCPGHYSVSIARKAGSRPGATATQNLPQYLLRVDEGDIYAEGVDELLYGRLSNVLWRAEPWPTSVRSTGCRSSAADAKEHNVTCHFCIVGCGYKAYTWDANRQGGTAPGQNKFGVDLSKQQDARDAELVRALDVQHRQAERPRRSHRHQAR